MTKPKRYKRYSAEFKREAILRAGEDGITSKAVCDELGISTRQFRRWRDELELLGQEAFPGKGKTRDQELTDLKRELIKVKKETSDEIVEDRRVRGYTPGSFERHFTLNPKIDREGLSAKYEEGILTVILPKKEGSETFRQDIEIV